MKPNAAPIAACPYPLALRHHSFLKQEIKSSLNGQIIQKNMMLLSSPIVVVKKNIPEGAPQQLCLCIDYGKVSCSLPAATQAEGTKTGAHTYASAQN